MVLKRRQSSQDYAADYYNDFDPPIVDDYRNSMCDNVFNGGGGMQYGDDVNGKKKAGSQTSNVAKYFWVAQYVVFTIIALNAWRTNDRLFKTGSELTKVNTDYTFLEGTITDTERELELAHEEFDRLKSAFKSIKPKPELGFGVDMKEGRKAVHDTVIERHEAQSSRIVRLQKYIQQIHLQEIKERSVFQILEF